MRVLSGTAECRVKSGCQSCSWVRAAPARLCGATTSFQPPCGSICSIRLRCCNAASPALLPPAPHRLNRAAHRPNRHTSPRNPQNAKPLSVRPRVVSRNSVTDFLINHVTEFLLLAVMRKRAFLGARSGFGTRVRAVGGTGWVSKCGMRKISGARWCSFDRFPALVVGRCSSDASLRLGWAAPSGRGISKCLDRTRRRDYQALGGYADVSPGVAIRASYANVPEHFGFVYGPIGTGRSRPGPPAGGFPGTDRSRSPRMPVSGHSIGMSTDASDARQSEHIGRPPSVPLPQCLEGRRDGSSCPGQTRRTAQGEASPCTPSNKPNHSNDRSAKRRRAANPTSAKPISINESAPGSGTLGGAPTSPACTAHP